MNKPKIISILGPESSGKTSLCIFLSDKLNASYSPELARIYLEKKGKNYLEEDVLEMAQMQFEQTKKLSENAKKLLIADSNSLNFKVWLSYKFKNIPFLIEELIKAEKNHYLLLCFPDLDYEADPLRENPSHSERMEIYLHYLNLLEKNPNFLGIVRDEGEKRNLNALELINTRFSL